MSGTDTGLRFWLRYVQARGGLTEDLGDSSLVVLPSDVQTLLNLPDELIVTGDPDVAREDGAMFLAAGHPVLGQAADDVLAGGDVARLAIPVPAAPPPETPVLLERARDQFPVDHGRIDATGAPTKRVRLVLRVGALVSYTVSAEDHYQERVECYLDACSHLELPESASLKLASLPRVVPRGQADTSRLTAAIGEAHRIIGARAEQRQAGLSGQATKACAAELERAEVYYRDMLATIARRRENAPAERRQLLAARTEAVRAERARRLAEIREKYQPSHAIRPYRLHVYEVPVWQLPVDVRRGDRRYPLTLDWLMPLARFADIRCPHCGGVEPLVASKTRLGCTGCLAKPPAQAVPNAPAADPGPAATRKPPSPAQPGPATSARLASPSRPATPAKVTGAAGGATGPATRGTGAAAGATRPAALRAADLARLPDPEISRISPAKVAKMGDKLSEKLWEAVASGDRRSSRMCAPESPAAAAVRLYGPAWAAVAIGIPATETPMATGSSTELAEAEALQATRGFVETAPRRRFPFLLWWRLVDGTPLIDEIVPFDAALDPARLPYMVLGPGRGGMVNAAQPRGALGAVGDQLWQRGLPQHGLPIVLRCLAAWWRLPEHITTALTASHGPITIAAAIERLICYRAAQSGARFAEAAATYRVAENAVRAASTDLQAKLQLSRTKLW